MQDGQWEIALRIAAKFPRLGPHKIAIERAHQAYSNPAFFRQIKLDPEALKAEGRRALLARYAIRESDDNTHRTHTGHIGMT